MKEMDKSEEEQANTLVPSTSGVVKVRWKDGLWQILAAFSVQAIALQRGINLAYSAILLPALRNPNSDIQINQHQASWIASLLTLFLPIGSLAMGPLTDTFGRKRICIFTVIPYCLSWLIIIFSTEVYHIYIARIIGGFSGGLANIVLVYVSETCHPVFRATLLSLHSVTVSFGILLTSVLGMLMSWRLMAIIFDLLAIFGMITMVFIPESPYWIASFKKDASTEQLTKPLKWLYKNPQIYEQQYEQVKKKKIAPTTKEHKGKGIIKETIENLKILTEPIVYKPTIILFFLFLFQQLSGGYVIIFYAIDVLQSLSKEFASGIDEYLALVLMAVIRVIISVISALISKKYGRRTLMFLSCLGNAISCLGLSFYIMFFKSESWDIFALICILSFVCFGSLGFLSIPWSLIGEILPVRVKGKIGGVMITTVNLMMFATVKTFPALMEACTIETIFLLFALDNLIAVCFVYWFLPETLGKSFEEIENCFQKKSTEQTP